MVGNINAYSPVFNSHYHRRQNAIILEKLINQFRILINNEPRSAIRPLSRDISIINLALSSLELCSLNLWEISEEYPSLSDHEFIVL